MSSGASANVRLPVCPREWFSSARQREAGSSRQRATCQRLSGHELAINVIVNVLGVPKNPRGPARTATPVFSLVVPDRDPLTFDVSRRAGKHLTKVPSNYASFTPSSTTSYTIAYSILQTHRSRAKKRLFISAYDTAQTDVYIYNNVNISLNVQSLPVFTGIPHSLIAHGRRARVSSIVLPFSLPLTTARVDPVGVMARGVPIASRRGLYDCQEFARSRDVRQRSVDHERCTRMFVLNPRRAKQAEGRGWTDEIPRAKQAEDEVRRRDRSK
ncbi:hypothetical protein FKP32DRAFT_1606038 [Trametes sanguinea]|nr:hypothetical protein FKP32DRAFT_1606038 [Trametes sanguinea]